MTDAPAIGSELDRAGSIIDACGESAKRGEIVDLSGLDSTVEGLCKAIMELPEAARAPLKPRMIDLIDRLNKMVGELKTQQASISEDVQDLSSRHRAVSAYGKGANTSTPKGRGTKRR